MTIGYLAVYARFSVPITSGVKIVADALSWLGAAIGVVLATVGLLVLAGRSLSLSPSLRAPLSRERRLPTMVLFGAAYGTASQLP